MKQILIPIIILFILIEAILLFRIKTVGTDPEELCRASNGGWAPAGMDSGELQTIDGNRLPTDSPLIDNEGYTCYCHTENTYWDGKTCVLKKKVEETDNRN